MFKTIYFLVGVLATGFIRLVSNLYLNYINEHINVSNEIIVSLIYDALLFAVVIVSFIFITDYFVAKKKRLKNN